MLIFFSQESFAQTLWNFLWSLVRLERKPVGMTKKIDFPIFKAWKLAISGPFERQRQKTYLWMCAPREDSDQTAHSRSLIWIFTGWILDSHGCKVSSCGQQKLYRLIWVSWAHCDVRRYVFHIVAHLCRKWYRMFTLHNIVSFLVLPVLGLWKFHISR